MKNDAALSARARRDVSKPPHERYGRDGDDVAAMIPISIAQRPTKLQTELPARGSVAAALAAVCTLPVVAAGAERNRVTARQLR